jgi:putative membrane protein
MIRGYSDHAANERTFLARVRTAIAVIAYGFVIDTWGRLAVSTGSPSSLLPAAM